MLQAFVETTTYSEIRLSSPLPGQLHRNSSFLHKQYTERCYPKIEAGTQLGPFQSFSLAPELTTNLIDFVMVHAVTSEKLEHQKNNLVMSTIQMS